MLWKIANGQGLKKHQEVVAHTLNPSTPGKWIWAKEGVSGQTRALQKHPVSKDKTNHPSKTGEPVRVPDSGI